MASSSKCWCRTGCEYEALRPPDLQSPLMPPLLLPKPLPLDIQSSKSLEAPFSQTFID